MDDDDGRGLRDAAAVRAGRLQIDAAIAELATRPLDEAAAVRMRRVLQSASSARAALRRLEADGASGPSRPGRLVAVEPVEADGGDAA